MSEVLLRVEQLQVTFRSRTAAVKAVRDATFDVREGSMTGLVGESGSGKTATGLALLGLHDERSTTIGGSAVFEGEQLVGMPKAALSKVRGARLAMVFQEPMTALNPLLTIGMQVAETVRAHTDASRKEAKARAIEVLGDVGIPDPRRRYGMYAHELSGGLRQRAMIAAAIACRPKLLVADEPTTALDVTIQGQILQLLRRLCETEHLAVLLVTHDLGVVSQVCDEMVTMYAGETVETGPVRQVLQSPGHPYTERLLAARPEIGGWGRRLESVPGRVPAASEELTGCLFGPRCRERGVGCGDTQVLAEFATGRLVRCVQRTGASRPEFEEVSR